MNRTSVLTISSTGDKILYLSVRQVEPAYLEIVFCKHHVGYGKAYQSTIPVGANQNQDSRSARIALNRYTYILECVARD